VQGRLLEELFSNTALFAQPSELEGLSIGLIEAMSFGAPCLASNIPENVEVVGNAGLLFQNKDAADLEAQLTWALANKDILTRLAAMGRTRAQELFSWEAVVDKLEQLYQQVAFGTRSHGTAVLEQPIS
jgi:glycosyltransferase involved in cell wall biosynthesis